MKEIKDYLDLIKKTLDDSEQLHENQVNFVMSELTRVSLDNWLLTGSPIIKKTDMNKLMVDILVKLISKN